MRILFVSHYATPHIGGIESVIHWLRRELKSRGHEVVHVASSASHYPLDDLPPDEGVIRVPALNVLENTRNELCTGPGATPQPWCSAARSGRAGTQTRWRWTVRRIDRKTEPTARATTSRR